MDARDERGHDAVGPRDIERKPGRSDIVMAGLTGPASVGPSASLFRPSTSLPRLGLQTWIPATSAGMPARLNKRVV